MEEINKHFEEIASLYGLSEEEADNVFGKIEQAIIANYISRLIKRLTYEETEAIRKREIGSEVELFKILKETVSLEESKEIMAEAVEEIFKKFIDRI